MRRGITRLILAGALMCGAASAWAGSATTFMQVSVNVVPNCRLSITDLAFGNYDPLLDNADRPLDGAAQLQMVCTKNSQASVMFDSGQHGVGSNRGMVLGSDRVSYDLFRDSARTQHWADSADALHVTGTGSRDPQQFTVFGRVPGGQAVGAGAYSDIVTASVDF
jgi:spore coat protein U-like protein